jgi:hypothetical protein
VLSDGTGPAEPLHLVYEDRHLRMSAIERPAGRAIVSFTGIGMRMQSEPVEEFLKTLNAISPDASKYFVIDKERSWYEHSFTQIVCRLAPLLARHDDVVLLGNSMGGFGSVLFSGLFPNVRMAIAFVPQFSVAPHITQGNEHRFDEHLGRIDRFSIDHACLFPKRDVRKFIVFGQEDDDWHIARYREHLGPHDAMLLVGGTDHDAVASLRQQGLLVPLLTDLFDGNGFARTTRRLASLNLSSTVVSGDSE